MRVLATILVIWLVFQANIAQAKRDHDEDTLRIKIIVENPAQSETATEILTHLKHDFKVHIDGIETSSTEDEIPTHKHLSLESLKHSIKEHFHKDSSVDSTASNSHEGFDDLKRTIKDLYEDSAHLWSLWEKLAGDKWDKNQQRLKDAKDEGVNKVYGTFYGVMNDLKTYYEALQKSTEEAASDTQSGLAEILEKLKDTYKSFKDETKAKIEGVANPSSLEEKLDESVQAANDLYDEAKERFLRIKEVLQHKIEKLSKQSGHLDIEKDLPKSDDVSHESLKDKVKGLLSKFTDAWEDFKTKIGDKLEKVDDSIHKKLHSAFERVKDDIHTLHTFLNKDYVRLNKEAKSLLHHFLDELTDQYGHLKFHAELLASDVKEGLHEAKMKPYHAYEHTLANYEVVRARIQSEVDYITGKITKTQYETAMKARSKYEKFIEESKSTMKKIEEIGKHPIDSINKALNPIALKIRELYVDSINTFLELDSKFAPYWDDITGKLKKVKDSSSQKVRETFQNATDDIKEIEHMVSESLHKHKGSVDQKLHDRIKHFEDAFNKLKEKTKEKYHHWVHGKGDDKALEVAYDKAREEYLQSKELLIIEIRKYYIIDSKNKSIHIEF